SGLLRQPAPAFPQPPLPPGAAARGGGRGGPGPGAGRFRARPGGHARHGRAQAPGRSRGPLRWRPAPRAQRPRGARPQPAGGLGHHAGRARRLRARAAHPVRRRRGRALQYDFRLHQELPRRRSRRGDVLARQDAGRRRGPPLHRAAPGHPGERGRRPGRSPGAAPGGRRPPGGGLHRPARGRAHARARDALHRLGPEEQFGDAGLGREQAGPGRSAGPVGPRAPAGEGRAGQQADGARPGLSLFPRLPRGGGAPGLPGEAAAALRAQGCGGGKGDRRAAGTLAQAQGKPETVGPTTSLAMGGGLAHPPTAMVLLDILGGVALILFGIRFLRKGLERMFGHSLHAWLERMAQQPVSTLASGAAVGTIAPSSTAQTLLSLQLLQVPTVPPERVLIFLLGTNIGITAMVQLIALRFFDYYGAFLVAGLIGFQFCKSETVRGIGQTLLGLGFIYLAMSLMSSAAGQMTANQDFGAVFGVLLHHRVLLVAFAAIFTFITQSSTASIGLALAVGEAGAGSLAL